MPSEIPAQEQTRKWFRSHLLNREVELQELYELPQAELDLLMAETAEIRADPENHWPKPRTLVHKLVRARTGTNH